MRRESAIVELSVASCGNRETLRGFLSKETNAHRSCSDALERPMRGESIQELRKKSSSLTVSPSKSGEKEGRIKTPRHGLVQRGLSTTTEDKVLQRAVTMKMPEQNLTCCSNKFCLSRILGIAKLIRLRDRVFSP